MCTRTGRHVSGPHSRPVVYKLTHTVVLSTMGRTLVSRVLAGRALPMAARAAPPHLCHMHKILFEEKFYTHKIYSGGHFKTHFTPGIDSESMEGAQLMYF